MAKYRVLEQSFINDKLAEKGDIIDFTGAPGSNLELVKNQKTAPVDNTDDASDLA